MISPRRNPLGALALTFALLAALLPVAAYAQVKIGFVNYAQVLEKSPQEEAARARIEEEFAPRDRELLAQQRRVVNQEDLLVKNGAIMSAAERQKLESEIRTLKREWRRSQEEFREDLNLRRSQELSKLQRKVTEVIREMAKAEAFDLIITDGVIFAGQRVDITNRVLELLQREFKASN